LIVEASSAEDAIKKAEACDYVNKEDQNFEIDRAYDAQPNE
jgi:hypothetical protein